MGREPGPTLPKLIPVPTFSQIRNTLQYEMSQYQEQIVPYRSAIQTKTQQIITIDAQLKDMSQQHDTLELRIQKYEALQNIDPQKKNRNKK